jgi:hypothetical protein
MQQRKQPKKRKKQEMMIPKVLNQRVQNPIQAVHLVRQLLIMQ